MPTSVKICIAAAVLWIAVYTASYSAAEFRRSNKSGGAAAAALCVLLVAAYAAFTAAMR